jgi:hypothetical protein
MMLYERSVKQYVCTSCGTVMNLQELLEVTERIRAEREKQEKSKRWKDEYLTWWLSSKK